MFSISDSDLPHHCPSPLAPPVDPPLTHTPRPPSIACHLLPTASGSTHTNLLRLEMAAAAFPTSPLTCNSTPPSTTPLPPPPGRPTAGVGLSWGVDLWLFFRVAQMCSGPLAKSKKRKRLRPELGENGLGRLVCPCRARTFGWNLEGGSDRLLTADAAEVKFQSRQFHPGFDVSYCLQDPSQRPSVTVHGAIYCIDVSKGPPNVAYLAQTR
jgi:hypothetical protein